MRTLRKRSSWKIVPARPHSGRPAAAECRCSRVALRLTPPPRAVASGLRHRTRVSRSLEAPTSKASRPSRPARKSGGEESLALRPSALLRLSAAIASAHTEKEVCRAVVDGLHDEALGYAFLGVFLLDPATGDRVLGAAIGWDDIPPDMRVPKGQGLSSQPVEDGTLRYAPDVPRGH